MLSDSAIVTKNLLNVSAISASLDIMSSLSSAQSFCFDEVYLRMLALLFSRISYYQ